MIKITFQDKEVLTNEDLNTNFSELLGLNVYNETPGGLINGSNTNFTTAFQFKPTTLRVYLKRSSPADAALFRQIKGTDYTEDVGYLGFTMTVAPPSGSIMVVDYQKENV